MVLETLAVANGLLVIAVGLIALFFVDGSSGPVLAVGCWIAAGVLFAIAARLRAGAGFE
jgi:hypothetical protein